MIILINSHTYSIVICPRSCLASVAPQHERSLNRPLSMPRQSRSRSLLPWRVSIDGNRVLFFNSSQWVLSKATSECTPQSKCRKQLWQKRMLSGGKHIAATRFQVKRQTGQSWHLNEDWRLVSRSIWFVVPAPILFPAAMSMSAKEGIPASCWFHKW